jgi:predicted nucleotidyltransferase
MVYMPQIGNAARLAAGSLTLAAVFTASERSALRDWLIALARADEQITAAAVLGSGADGSEDRWSDIDLAVRLTPGQHPMVAADSWAERLGKRVQLVSQLDMWSNGALYRVFLLPDTLQVDISFWPDDRFAAYGPKFHLVFGEPNDAVGLPAVSPGSVLGMAWLYALHIRSSIARGRTWQALYMINGARDQVVQLACLRQGLPSAQGRGADDLSPGLKSALKGTLPQTTEDAELRRCFGEIARLVVDEACHVDPKGARELEDVLAELVRTAESAATDSPATRSTPTIAP